MNGGELQVKVLIQINLTKGESYSLLPGADKSKTPFVNQGLNIDEL